VPVDFLYLQIFCVDLYFFVPADVRTSRFISVFFVVLCPCDALIYANLRVYKAKSIIGGFNCLQSHSQYNCLSVTLSSACRPLELCAPRELGQKEEK